MLGQCSTESGRRFTPETVGLPSRLSRDGMEWFWGDNVGEMNNLVWARLKNGNTLKASITQKKQIELKLHDIESIDTVCVKYSGSGKYSESNVCVLWEDVPCHVEDGCCPDLINAEFGRLIDPTDVPKMQFRPELEGDKTAGWWPCAIVNWKTEAQDNGYDCDQSTYRRWKRKGKVGSWAICWYQLFDGSWVLVLWRIFLRTEDAA